MTTRKKAKADSTATDVRRGGILTDAGGRPVTDAGGRPVFSAPGHRAAARGDRDGSLVLDSMGLSRGPV